MSTLGGASIIREGLVFGYDADDRSKRFYKGEPTVNLLNTIKSIDCTLESYNTGGTISYFGNDLGVGGSATISDQVSHTGTKSYKVVIGSSGGNKRLTSQSIPILLGDTVTISGWVKSSFVMTYRIYFTGGNYTWAGTNMAHTGSGNWEYLSATYGPATSDTNVFLFIYGSDFNQFFYIDEMQIEVKSHATQFINGSRSATESLIDLSKAYTLDLTNTEFNSLAHPTFNGGVGSGSRIAITPITLDLSSCSVEFWMKRNVLAATQDATNTYGSLRILYGAGSSRFLESRIAGDKFRFTGERDVSSEYWATFTLDVTADLEYHHVVINSVAGVQTIYFDSVERGTYAPSFTTSAVTITDIGRGYPTAHAGYGSFFDGELPIMRFYNRALSQSEITQNFNATKSRFGL
jgi:hypothetical protein